MKAEMPALEEAVSNGVPAATVLAELIEALRQQMASEERRKAVEHQERARFNVD